VSSAFFCGYPLAAILARSCSLTFVDVRCVVSRKFDIIILSLLFALELLLFCTVYNREVAWYPPSYFDQAGYLASTYGLQEQALTHGLGKLWKALGSTQNPTGVALPIDGAIFGIILGGGRLPQLCVNLVLFFALQAVAFWTGKTVWKTRLHGYLLVGLILSQGTAWTQPGGLFDFRIDFAAYCLYGIWVCAILCSNVFAERRSISAGLIGAILVLHRFLTIIYLIGVLAGLAAICVLPAFWNREKPGPHEHTLVRLKNIGLSSLALILVAGPLLLANAHAIWNYYGVGHLLSEEKFLRANEVGAHGLLGHLLFYPQSIGQDHLGPLFFWAAAIPLGAALIARISSHSFQGGDRVLAIRNRAASTGRFSLFNWHLGCIADSKKPSSLHSDSRGQVPSGVFKAWTASC